MLILLPPSEGKTAPLSGPALDLNALSFPSLAPHRREVMDALAHVSASEDALATLGVGASLQDEVARNLSMLEATKGTAHTVYSGVLFDALGYSSLSAAQRAKADESIVVMSGLWGAVGFADPVPAYRLSMGAKLPGLGPLATWWRPRLEAELSARAEGALVIDARSSTYAAAFRPSPESAVTVDVVQERGGVRKVVSHFAKHTRGELVRHLIQRRGAAPATPRELLHQVNSWWPGSELTQATAKKPARLVIVLPEDHAFTARG